MNMHHLKLLTVYKKNNQWELEDIAKNKQTKTHRGKSQNASVPAGTSHCNQTECATFYSETCINASYQITFAKQRSF